MRIVKSTCARLLPGFLMLLQAIPAMAQEFSPQFIADELARTRSDPDSEITLTIKAPRQFVFDFLTQRVDEYVSDANQVGFDHSNSARAGELAPGSDRVITMENSETLVQRFLRFEPPDGYAYFVDMARSTLEAPLDHSISRYQLTAIDADTTGLTTSVVYRSSSRLLAFFVRRGFESALRRDFSRAGKVIEAEYQSTQ